MLIRSLEMKFPRKAADSKDHGLADHTARTAVAGYEQHEKAAEEGRYTAIQSRAYT